MTKQRIKQHSVKPSVRKVKRIMLTIPVVLLACVFILVGVLLAFSPGKPVPFLDQNGNQLPGSISEKIFVNINGVQQGMIIKSKDMTNPVLLYVHGGMPDYFLTQKYPTGLENYFTVVWWEQRGSGLSFNPGVTQKVITSKQLISDTLEVTNYLRNRFGKEKIYLMGHSGGTFIGIQAASQAPELYYAYIGIAQMSNQLDSERLADEYMLQRFKENGNSKMVRKLEAAPVTINDPIPDSFFLLRDGAMHSLGIGTTHDMRSVISGIFLPSLTFREYTVREKFNLWRGKSQSGVSSIWNEITTKDLSTEVTGFEIPVYIMAGRYDYTVNYDLQKNYFMKINAPEKGFYTFDNSAHSPLFEEPETFIEIMVSDVLNGKVNLADK
jgi:pimeloyl-ACP methyl ester carboxylesterase